MLVVDMSGSPAMALGPLLTDIPNTANIEVSIYTYLMAIIIMLYHYFYDVNQVLCPAKSSTSVRLGK